jgi:hypothetical protein
VTVSDDQALALVGLILVVGILLGIVWIFFNVVVDVVLVLAIAAGGCLWWWRRRPRR